MLENQINFDEKIENTGLRPREFHEMVESQAVFLDK
jgi:hypothetical protein